MHDTKQNVNVTIKLNEKKKKRRCKRRTTKRVTQPQSGSYNTPMMPTQHTNYIMNTPPPPQYPQFQLVPQSVPHPQAKLAPPLLSRSQLYSDSYAGTRHPSNEDFNPISRSTSSESMSVPVSQPPEHKPFIIPPDPRAISHFEPYYQPGAQSEMPQQPLVIPPDSRSVPQFIPPYQPGDQSEMPQREMVPFDDELRNAFQGLNVEDQQLVLHGPPPRALPHNHGAIVPVAPPQYHIPVHIPRLPILQIPRNVLPTISKPVSLPGPFAVGFRRNVVESRAPREDDLRMLENIDRVQGRMSDIDSNSRFPRAERERLERPPRPLRFDSESGSNSSRDVSRGVSRGGSNQPSESGSNHPSMNTSRDQQVPSGPTSNQVVPSSHGYGSHRQPSVLEQSSGRTAEERREIRQMKDNTTAFSPARRDLNQLVRDRSLYIPDIQAAMKREGKK